MQKPQTTLETYGQGEGTATAKNEREKGVSRAFVTAAAPLWMCISFMQVD